MPDLTLSGATDGQPVSDVATVSPFAGVAIATTAASTPYATATVALSSTANGALSRLGVGTLSADGATYTVSGSPALVQAALRGLVFTPVAHEVPVGQSVATGFTLTVSDAAGAVTDTRTSVVATAADTLPTVVDTSATQVAQGFGDLLPGLPDASHFSFPPFAFTTIADPDAGASETTQIAFTQNGAATDAVGLLSGAGLTKTGVGAYALAAAAPADETAALKALRFTPTNPGTATSFNVTTMVSDGFGAPVTTTSTVGLSANPGGSTVRSNSTNTVLVYNDTRASSATHAYATVIDAVLNGGSVVYERTFDLPYSDPQVQAAVTQAQAALRNAGASPGPPALQVSRPDSQSQTSTLETGRQYDGNAQGTTTQVFGPTYVGPSTSVGGASPSGYFFVLTGQLDTNFNAQFEQVVSRTVTTTSTDLLSQQYVITGTSAAMPTTTLVSSSAAGVEGNAASSTTGVIEGITADGTSVLFGSGATNLVPGYTSANGLYLKNTATGAITEVSSDAASVVANRPIDSAAVDANGGVVVFATASTNLDPTATNGLDHLYVHNVAANTQTLLSPSAYVITNAMTGAVEPANIFLSLNNPTISSDGRYIAATSGSRVALFDTTTHTALDILPGVNGQQAYAPVVSQDGSQVAFASDAVPPDLAGSVPANTGFAQAYEYTVASNSFALVSGTAGANTPSVAANRNVANVTASNDGSRVAFVTRASNLDDRATDGSFNLYVKDLITGRLFLVDVTADGSAKANSGVISASISGDGAQVAFLSTATNLVPGVTDGLQHVFVETLATGAISILDRSSAGVAGDQSASNAVFAPDSAHVAFSSSAGNLVANDTNGVQDVFLTAVGAATTPPAGPAIGGASASVSYTTGAVPVKLEPNATVTDGTGAITRVYLTVNSTDSGDSIGYDQPASLRNLQPAYTTAGADQGVIYEFDSVSPAGASTADVQAFLESVRYSSTSSTGARDVRVYLSDATTSHAPVGVTGGTPDALTHLTITPPANPGPPVISGVPAAATYTPGQATALAPNAVLSDPSGALSSVAVVIDHPNGADTYAYTTPAGLGVVSMLVPSPSGSGSAILIEAQSPDATASLAAFQAFLDSVTFTVPVADGAHTIQVSAYNGNQNATASELLSAGGGGAAVPPAVTGVPATETDPGQATIQPFSTAVITGTETGQTYTVSLEADRHGTQQAGGTVSGGGFTAAGPDGATFSSTSLAAVQAALRAVSFTPNSADTDVIYNITSPAGNSPVGHLEILAPAAPPPNTPPMISGAQAGQPDTAGVAISPFATVTVNDPDAGQTETVTVSFTAANGTLSGGGFVQTAPGVYSVTAPAGGAGASAAAAQADLRAATFTPAAGRSSTTSFTISVSDGQAPAATDSTTSVVAAYTPPAAGGGRGGTVTTTPPSVQYGLLTEFQNLERALAGGSDAVTPGTPVYAAFQAEKVIAAQLDNGQLFLGQAETALAHLVDGTTAVAVASYGFFTGSTPTAAGLNFLVRSPGNATDLNDAYYARFSTENRYINFAANLATGVGAGASAFAATYGSLSLADATAKAYAAVFGATADAAKVSALLDTLVPDGLGGQETRAQYFGQYGGDGPNGQGTKAAMIGFLLSNAVHDGSGVYGAATEHYLAALAHGQAPAFGSELALHYGPAVNLVGVTPAPDPAVTG